MYQGPLYQMQTPLYHCQINIMLTLQVKTVRYTEIRHHNQGHVVTVGQGHI